MPPGIEVPAPHDDYIAGATDGPQGLLRESTSLALR